MPGVFRRIDLRDLIETSHAQRLLKVVKRAFRLCVLLVQQIVQDVLVSLDEALGILLTMLELLVTITLDALEQSSEGELLLVAKLGFLFLDHCLHL